VPENPPSRFEVKAPCDGHGPVLASSTFTGIPVLRNWITGDWRPDIIDPAGRALLVSAQPAACATNCSHRAKILSEIEQNIDKTSRFLRVHPRLLTLR